MKEITMPRLSDSMEEGTILSWLKSDGDLLAAGDELVDIETDKATMTYEAPEGGVLSIIASPGSTLPVGAVIAKLGAAAESAADGAGEQTPPAVDESADQPTIADTAPPVPAPVSRAEENGDRNIRATPLARRWAQSHGIRLAEVAGTGPNGRIIRADVAARVGLEPPHAPASTWAPAAAISSEGPRAGNYHAGAKGEPRVQALTRLQQVVARRMAEVKSTVPEFQVQTEVRMDDALALRTQLKELIPDAPPSVNDLIVRAAAMALRLHPRANSSYKEGRFEIYPRVNVGIAVAAGDALIVPTIMDADVRSIPSIAQEARRLAARARSGEITPAELSGATFTVSNLGMFGMTAITPVINSPQAAILGVGTSRGVPVIEDGALVEHQMLTLTLSCDHRILYGADAAKFLYSIRELLERPLRLMF